MLLKMKLPNGQYPSLSDRINMHSSYYYAVKVGKTPGIYRTWNDCSNEVHGVKGAKYKKFASEAEAMDFISSDFISGVSEIETAFVSNAISTNAISTNAISTTQTTHKKTSKTPKTPRTTKKPQFGHPEHLNPIFSIIHPCFGDIGPFHPDRVMYVDGGCNAFTKPYACGSVVNHSNADLIEAYSSLFPDMTLVPMDLPVGRRLLIQVQFCDCASQQNNGAELLATVAGLRIAMRHRGHYQYLFSDSSLIVDFWSKRIRAESAEKMDPHKLRYIKELIQLTQEFEQSGGTIYKIDGGSNPADLGFH